MKILKKYFFVKDQMKEYCPDERILGDAFSKAKESLRKTRQSINAQKRTNRNNNSTLSFRQL